MNKLTLSIIIWLLTVMAVVSGPAGPARAMTAMPDPGGTPDYFATPNWANSPPLRKFVDTLPVLCSDAAPVVNNLGQCLPVAQPDTTTYAGSDYYEIEVGEFSERMHSDMP